MKHTALLLLALLSACAGSFSQVSQPALIVNATAASRTELLEIVRTALADAPLTLADDALMQASTLLVERVPRKDAAGVLINGRELGMPEQFQLFLRGSRCLLMRERTQQSWYLRHTQCRLNTGVGK
jgi:hypothetical protein